MGWRGIAPFSRRPHLLPYPYLPPRGPEVSLKCKSGYKAYLAPSVHHTEIDATLGLGANSPFILGPALARTLEPDMRVVLGQQERPKSEPIITKAREQVATAGTLG